MSDNKTVDLGEIETAAYVFEEIADGTYKCTKSRHGDVKLGGIYSRMTVRALSTQHHTVIIDSKAQEPHKLALVLPFNPPTPQAEVIALLERYAELARSGEVTGVIIAAKTPDDVLTGEIMAEYAGVNQRERTLLIDEIREVSSFEYDI